MIYDVLIIGSGPAGLTAGIYTSRAALKTLIIAGKTWGGQLQMTTDVENYPGFPEGIMGPDLMMKMRKQAERFGTTIIDQDVTAADFSRQPFTIVAHSTEYQAKSVIVATGADTVWLGVPGEQQFIGRGVSSCAPCDAFFYKNKNVIVVGGGDSAMEEALVLTKFASNVIVVHRRDAFRASKIMQDRVMNHPKIHIMWNAEVVEILGNQKVEKVKLRIRPSDKTLLNKTKEELEKIAPELLHMKILQTDAETITAEAAIDGVFVAVGHTPNSTVFKGTLETDAKGFIKRIPETSPEGVTLYRSTTNIPGVFVAGDVHDHHYKQAVTAAAYGCEAALDVEKWLEEKE